ncbi:potassium channel family protein [Mesorhizobium huakuii]|uniref:Two pore domain potassium channel family protein n=1 Tax=Mesorhizobium huakuii TaxID=28104 RepID=A0A7G6ST60_9HYPH|nr:potassium channel family protein [Mesorhizobium huakuii]QND57692.1 two pore domain potassium channel family protein [Mesorhizobium huakuii]
MAAGRWISKKWHSARDRHRAYLDFVSRHPISLVPLAALYVGLVAFLLVCCVVVVSSLVDFLWRGLEPDAKLNIVLPFTVIFLWGPLTLIVAAHYLYVTFVSFLSASQLRSFARPVFQVLQLVATTMIFFAAVHYYIALLTDGVAYDGLLRPMPEGGWSPWVNWFDKLIFVPSAATIVDCIYFSAVTMATVGYGDIKPLTMTAKIATIAEILFSFGLIVVVLGWVIGHAKGAGPVAPTIVPPTDSQTSAE